MCWFYSQCAYLLLTNDLKATVRVELANVSCAEPALAIFVHKKVFLVLRLIFIVTHSNIWPTNQNFPSRSGLVSTVVSAFSAGRKIQTKKVIV